VAVEQPFSIWKRIYTLEPHNAEWQEFIIADDNDEIMGNIKVLESPPGSKDDFLRTWFAPRERMRRRHRVRR